MKANYTRPVLCPKDHDMKKKDWFIYFRWTDPLTGERTPVKKRADLNSIQDKKERVSSGNILADVYWEKLKNGWNPLTDEVEKAKSILTLKVNIENVLASKSTSFTDKSKRSYKDIKNMFFTWMDKEHMSNIYPQYFTPGMAQKYMDYLLIDKGYSGKTHNTQLGIIKSWFKKLIDLEVIQKNPFGAIKEMQEEEGKNFAFTEEERKRLKEHLSKNNPRVYYACCFLFYLLIRPKELIRLRVQDINFENKTIVIHSATSKNRKQQSVTIPRSLEKIIYKMGLDMAPKEAYIFGHRLMTQTRKTVTANGLTGSHREALRELKIGEEKTFYSWKHTGACALFNATKDPYLVMQQCRHSDIKITMIYLRSMGLTVNEKIRQAEYNL